MKLPQIITSLLSNDLYKFSMGQAIYHSYSEYNTTWSFKCRNKNVKFTPEMVEEIKEQIQAYCSLRYTEDELTYLHSIGSRAGHKGWIHGNYINYLRLWQPRYEDFEISTDSPCGLSIETKGTWLNTSMYEIPTLAIVNEVYFRMQYNYDELLKSFKEKLDAKVENLKNETFRLGPFSEFGLRRRLSEEAQDYAVKQLAENCKGLPHTKFVGTSNVALARKYNLLPVGTMAHEFIMCVGQGDPRHNPAYANWYSMRAWVKEYGILNGTYLTDCIGDELCRRDMNLTYATVFSGVRNDSGDPYEWGNNWIKHYENLGIDPETKTLLFSNALDFKRATEIYDYFNSKIKTAFGIGTYIANDTNVEPLNIVMKVTKCNGSDVAKLSDDADKGMCKNDDYIEYLKRCINWRLNNSDN